MGSLNQNCKRTENSMGENFVILRKFGDAFPKASPLSFISSGVVTSCGTDFSKFSKSFFDHLVTGRRSSRIICGVAGENLVP